MANYPYTQGSSQQKARSRLNQMSAPEAYAQIAAMNTPRAQASQTRQRVPSGAQGKPQAKPFTPVDFHNRLVQSIADDFDTEFGAPSVPTSPLIR